MSLVSEANHGGLLCNRRCSVAVPSCKNKELLWEQESGLLRAGARCAVLEGAPETPWQAGRLPQFQRRKLLENQGLVAC